MKLFAFYIFSTISILLPICNAMVAVNCMSSVKDDGSVTARLQYLDCCFLNNGSDQGCCRTNVINVYSNDPEVARCNSGIYNVEFKHLSTAKVNVNMKVKVGGLEWESHNMDLSGGMTSGKFANPYGICVYRDKSKEECKSMLTQACQNIGVKNKCGNAGFLVERGW